MQISTNQFYAFNQQNMQSLTATADKLQTEIATTKRINAPSDAAIPALSCPRCCSAYRPRYVMFAASGWPKIPKTPHSSRNLSNINLPAGHDPPLQPPTFHRYATRLAKYR